MIKSKQLMSKKKNDVYFIGLKYAHSKQILQDQIRWGKKQVVLFIDWNAYVVNKSCKIKYPIK